MYLEARSALRASAGRCGAGSLSPRLGQWKVTDRAAGTIERRSVAPLAGLGQPRFADIENLRELLRREHFLPLDGVRRSMGWLLGHRLISSSSSGGSSTGAWFGRIAPHAGRWKIIRSRRGPDGAQRLTGVVLRTFNPAQLPAGQLLRPTTTWTLIFEPEGEPALHSISGSMRNRLSSA
jgi:hypothetical protein